MRRRRAGEKTVGSLREFSARRTFYARLAADFPREIRKIDGQLL